LYRGSTGLQRSRYRGKRFLQRYTSSTGVQGYRNGKGVVECYGCSAVVLVEYRGIMVQVQNRGTAVVQGYRCKEVLHVVRSSAGVQK